MPKKVTLQLQDILERRLKKKSSQKKKSCTGENVWNTCSYDQIDFRTQDTNLDFESSYLPLVTSECVATHFPLYCS